MRSLKGKVVIITGASRGVGRATALLFAEQGVRVVAAARRQGPLAELVGEIRQQGGEAMAVPTDITRLDACEGLAREAQAAYGAVDILVNNAGIGWVAPLVDHPIEEWRRVLDTNLDGVFYATRAVLPAMIAQRSGHIINVSSTLAKRPSKNWGAYVPAKYALSGLGEMLQLETKEHGIKVTTVFAGGVNNTFRDTFAKEYLPTALDPARLCTNEDIAEGIVWCARMGLSPTAIPSELTIAAWSSFR